MDIYFGLDDKIRMAYANCPFGCGSQEKADASDSDDAGRSRVTIKMNFHMANCKNNPEKEESEMDKFKKKLGINK